MSTLSARKSLLLIMLFVATSFGLIALDRRNAINPVRNGLHGLIVPVTQIFKRADATPGDPASLQARYDRMKAQYDALQADYVRLQMVAREVDQLRGLLKLQQTQPNLTFVSARVLYPDPTNSGKFVIIDKGANDGIKRGMAVTDPNFFVGIVTEVEDTKAKVTFAIDGTFTVGAELRNGQAVGIAVGMWQSGGRMELRHVTLSSKVAADDVIVTACASEARTAQIPCGLIIGKVGGPAQVNNQSDSQTVPILPVTDFDHLSVVAVIVSDDSGK